MSYYNDDNNEMFNQDPYEEWVGLFLIVLALVTVYLIAK